MIVVCCLLIVMMLLIALIGWVFVLDCYGFDVSVACLVVDLCFSYGLFILLCLTCCFLFGYCLAVGYLFLGVLVWYVCFNVDCCLFIVVRCFGLGCLFCLLGGINSVVILFIFDLCIVVF